MADLQKVSEDVRCGHMDLLPPGATPGKINMEDFFHKPVVVRFHGRLLPALMFFGLSRVLGDRPPRTPGWEQTRKGSRYVRSVRSLRS